MKQKFRSLFALTMAIMLLLSLTSCFDLGGGGGGGGNPPLTPPPGVEWITPEQMDDMNEAVAQTKEYSGSYTIQEVTVTTAYVGGQPMQTSTQTGAVGYDADTKNLYYIVDAGDTNVLVYNERHPDGSYTQYQNMNGTKKATDFSSATALRNGGLAFTNGAGKQVSFYFNDLSEALKGIFLVDLSEITSITNAGYYTQFWIDSYESRLDQMLNTYGLSATYSDNGSEMITEDDSVIFTFSILGETEGAGVIGGETIQNYSLELTVDLVITGGKLDKIISTVEQSFTLQGITVSATSVSTDEFLYHYNGEVVPSPSELEAFPKAN